LNEKIVKSNWVHIMISGSREGVRLSSFRRALDTSNPTYLSQTPALFRPLLLSTPKRAKRGDLRLSERKEHQAWIFLLGVYFNVFLDHILTIEFSGIAFIFQF